MNRDDRVFVSDGRRHFRRTYSRTEVRAGLAVLLGLALLLVWVGWKGAHPDPSLFGEGVVPPGGAAGEGADDGYTNRLLQAKRRARKGMQDQAQDDEGSGGT